MGAGKTRAGIARLEVAARLHISSLTSRKVGDKLKLAADAGAKWGLTKPEVDFTWLAGVAFRF